MAIAQAAARAGRAAVAAAPQLKELAVTVLKKATNGAVSDPSQIATYIGKSEPRLQVVADSLIRSGVPVDDIFPEDFVGSRPQLAQMRQAALALAGSLKQQFDSGADKVLPAQTVQDTAADVIRIKRVKAAMAVFGSEEAYHLCIPNGGIPAADFAFARVMQKALYSAR